MPVRPRSARAISQAPQAWGVRIGDRSNGLKQVVEVEDIPLMGSTGLMSQPLIKRMSYPTVVAAG